MIPTRRAILFAALATAALGLPPRRDAVGNAALPVSVRFRLARP